MDPVTHTLCGVALGNGLFRRRAGPAAVPILALASNLPDIDAVVHLSFDPAAVLMRRTFGHSIFLVPLWSLLLAWLLRRRYRHLRLSALFGMVIAGAAVHLFFDLINSFGVVLLWPLSAARPELAWVFILDLVLTGLLLLPLLLAAAPRLRPRIQTLSRATLLLVAVYLAFCGGCRLRARGLLMDEEARITRNGSEGRATFSYVFPEPLGPQRWRGVLGFGDRYELFLVRPLTGTVEPRGSVQGDADDPLVRAARATPFGRRLDQFFKAPVWQVRHDAASASQTTAGSQVVAWDLRFKSLVVDRGPVFEFVVPVTPAR